jgi:hypothetical protein
MGCIPLAGNGNQAWTTTRSREVIHYETSTSGELNIRRRKKRGSRKIYEEETKGRDKIARKKE